jgi:uncharacterized protein YjbI with pentapeptide repeats
MLHEHCNSGSIINAYAYDRAAAGAGAGKGMMSAPGLGPAQDGRAAVADLEHVERLKQGVKVWNAWRRDNPTVRPDLTGTDLTGADVTGIDLTGAALMGAKLSRAKLSAVHLVNANLSEADMSNAQLDNADLSNVVLFDADLTNAYLRNAQLDNADLSNDRLFGIYRNGTGGGGGLSAANLTGADLSYARLRGTNLHNARLSEVHLVNANLSDANLRGANLTTANLTGADLKRADFNRADLHWANLNSTDLSGTNLSGTNLHSANLGYTRLSGANLNSARLFRTVFANVDLTNVIGLETCIHDGPSVIDPRTLEISLALPLQFLRGVGLPDRLIEYLPALFNQAIQHYSCFISYSAKDDNFAHRLHADLQNSGVRCWFAPHDLPIGEPILDGIDAAIRLRDKVVLIISEHSIRSGWVKDEVTAGFEEERKRGQIMLFPVRLDDAVMTTNEAWAAKLRARNIGDFRSWKDHDAYQRSFEPALRDLTISPLPPQVP